MHQRVRAAAITSFGVWRRRLGRYRSQGFLSERRDPRNATGGAGQRRRWCYPSLERIVLILVGHSALGAVRRIELVEHVS